jgi:hypothetical protein
MGRIKINRGPPNPVRHWKIYNYYGSSKQMIKIIEDLKITSKSIYVRKINKPYIKNPYIIYVKC